MVILQEKYHNIHLQLSHYLVINFISLILEIMKRTKIYGVIMAVILTIIVNTKATNFLGTKQEKTQSITTLHIDKQIIINID